MRESFTEITRLEPLDIFYVGERHKTYFEYPAHCHEVYELNFVENAAGATRTIGDSHETIGPLDLNKTYQHCHCNCSFFYFCR